MLLCYKFLCALNLLKHEVWQFCLFPDLDECALGIHDCPADVLCENNFGSYSCLCNGGFVQNATNGLCDSECENKDLHCGLN